MSSTLHSLIDNLVAAGTIYGWRLDAILISGLLWAMSSSFRQLQAAF